MFFWLNLIGIFRKFFEFNCNYTLLIIIFSTESKAAQIKYTTSILGNNEIQCTQKNTCASIEQQTLIPIHTKSIYGKANDSGRMGLSLLLNFLFKYSAIEKKGGFVKLALKNKFPRFGDTSFNVKLIKKYLIQSGDILINDTGFIFNSVLQIGIKSFQKRLGFDTTGILTKPLIAEMNVPIEKRIRQLKINIERLRNFNPAKFSDFLLVNIPEFKLHLFEANQLMWSMDIIVGKIKNPTAVFNNKIQYVVFNPYWNIPNSILRNEIFPLLKRNKNYLNDHNMEWVGDKLRQRPGPDNPLGRIKFLFPNKFNIYLHDTPAKSLFKNEIRAFSHGCIRIADAEKLAQYLLRNEPNWDKEKIKKSINANVENYVELKEPMTIFIEYFSCWVDELGRLNFRKDIYSKD